MADGDKWGPAFLRPLEGLRRGLLPAKRPLRVGLVLGGGGARGMAHIGVLKVLEDQGLTVDLVAGTSMGGLIAVAYAGGVTVADMLKLAVRTRVLRLLGRDRTGLALASTDRVGAMLVAAVGVERMEGLRLPCAVVAGDAVTGQRIVIDSGSIARAVQATIAIPGVLSPVRDGEMILVDGGIVDPVPVRAARALGAEMVIAVDVSADPRRPLRDAPGTGLVPPRIAASLRMLRVVRRERMIDVMVKAWEIQGGNLAAARLQIDRPEVIIKPKLESVSADQFEEAGTVIASGEAAAREALPQIARAMGIR